MEGQLPEVRVRIRVRVWVRVRVRVRVSGGAARLEHVESSLGEASAHLGISQVGDHRDALQAARVLQGHLSEG